MDVTATAMLPYPDADLARSALRARLRDIIRSRQVPAAALEGATMVVAGPTEVTDATGRTWFQWIATLKTRPEAPSGPGRSGDARPPTVADLGLLRRRAG